MLSIDVLKITLHSAAAEEIIKNYITFLDPRGINYVIIVGPTVFRGSEEMQKALLVSGGLRCVFSKSQAKEDQGWNGPGGSGFSVRAVPLSEGFLSQSQYCFNRKARFRFLLGSCKTVLAVPVLLVHGSSKNSSDGSALLLRFGSLTLDLDS